MARYDRFPYTDAKELIRESMEYNAESADERIAKAIALRAEADNISLQAGEYQRANVFLQKQLDALTALDNGGVQ